MTADSCLSQKKNPSKRYQLTENKNPSKHYQLTKNPSKCYHLTENGSTILVVLVTCGTDASIEDGIKATGLTFKLDPIMMSKSTSFLSLATASWNSLPRPSPKKTMSGFIMDGAKSWSGEDDVLGRGSGLVILHLGHIGIC